MLSIPPGGRTAGAPAARERLTRTARRAIFKKMKPKPTLLAVFAHPDDEAYGPGGTLAKYAILGADVHMITFTCGEAGSIGVSKTLPPDELCRRRREELHGAADALGLASCRIVGEPDGGLERIDEEKGARIVLGAIREIRPHVVITFHREGVSGHADHKAVYRFVRRAFALAGDDRPRRLFGWCILESRLHIYRGERKIYAADDSEVAAVIDIPRDAMDRKIDAIERHETQIEFFGQLKEWFGDYRDATSREFFERIDRRGGAAGPVVTDLFDGIDGAAFAGTDRSEPPGDRR